MGELGSSEPCRTMIPENPIRTTLIAVACGVSLRILNSAARQRRLLFGSIGRHET